MSETGKTTMVMNLATREKQTYFCEPRLAVLSAYAQSRKDRLAQGSSQQRARQHSLNLRVGVGRTGTLSVPSRWTTRRRSAAISNTPGRALSPPSSRPT